MLFVKLNDDNPYLNVLFRLLKELLLFNKNVIFIMI